MDCLRWISYGYPIYALGMVMVQAINGAGDTGTPTKINFVCYWMIQIPLAWVLAQHLELGPTGVFMAVFGAEILLTAGAVWAFNHGRWKLKEL